ncbi:hypothetical protein BJY59DRAFT_13200 [Rhodotorula toruloides]
MRRQHPSPPTSPPPFCPAYDRYTLSHTLQLSPACSSVLARAASRPSPSSGVPQRPACFAGGKRSAKLKSTQRLARARLEARRTSASRCTKDARSMPSPALCTSLSPPAALLSLLLITLRSRSSTTRGISACWIPERRSCDTERSAELRVLLASMSASSSTSSTETSASTIIAAVQAKLAVPFVGRQLYEIPSAAQLAGGKSPGAASSGQTQRDWIRTTELDGTSCAIPLSIERIAALGQRSYTSAARAQPISHLWRARPNASLHQPNRSRPMLSTRNLALMRTRRHCKHVWLSTSTRSPISSRSSRATMIGPSRSTTTTTPALVLCPTFHHLRRTLLRRA